MFYISTVYLISLNHFFCLFFISHVELNISLFLLLISPKNRNNYKIGLCVREDNVTIISI